MKGNRHPVGNDLEKDPLWDLLAKDAIAHPVETSPWFATRTSARALAADQTRSRGMKALLRWFLPLPLAGVAALLFLSLHHGSLSKGGSFVSSQEEFEQNMEMLFSPIE
jgi:hypothetical protein